MAVFTYEATRSLIGAHSEGENYEIRLGLESLHRTTKTDKKTGVSMDGDEEVHLNRHDIFWQFLTIEINESDMEPVREFIDSIIDGQVFLYDRLGALGAPNNPIQVSIDGDPTEQPTQRSRKVKVSFKVRVRS